MKKITFFFVLALVVPACKRDKVTLENVHTITVKNAAGEPQPDAQVKLFYSVSDLMADTNAYLSLTTGSSGSVLLPGSNYPESLICKAEKGTLTSEFTAMQYTASNRTFQVVISQPSSAQCLVGHGTKQWLMTSYSINGSPQNYVVTSTLNADGTWTDSNGNAGSWHFAGNDQQLVYDYTSSGMTIVFDVLELTKSLVRLKSVQPGMTIEMEMTAV